jgi:hypothetical protein
MAADTGRSDALCIHTLGDALGIGMELLELFRLDGDCCAVWLGSADGSMRDFVICNEDRGRDADRLLRYAACTASVLGDVSRAVLWRTVDDITDAPALAEEFFDHQHDLASVGVTLLDEIVLRDDELRSLAVTSFSDCGGWDDVTARIATLEDGHDVPWPPWAGR